MKLQYLEFSLALWSLSRDEESFRATHVKTWDLSFHCLLRWTAEYSSKFVAFHHYSNV